MNVLRKDVSNGKKTCGWSYEETLSDGSNRTKPPISNGNPKSDFSDMDVFTEHKRFWVVRLVRGARYQEGKLAGDYSPT